MILSLISGILSGFFGWTGGRGDDYWRDHPTWPRWILQSWTRDWLVSLVFALSVWILGVHSWWILLSIPITAAALSTYWDPVFGYDNYWIHGLFVGLAAFPIAIATGHWWIFLIRSLILCVWMGAWSAIFKDADIEESGRYFIVGVTAFMC